MSVPGFKREEEERIDEVTGEPTTKVGRKETFGGQKGRAATYEEGAKARAPGEQKGPINKELDKKEHELTKVARKVRQMGVKVTQRRNRDTGRVEWKAQGKTYNYLTFGKFAEGVLHGDGRGVTVGDLARMATDYAKWVGDNYLLPKDEQIAKDGFPKPWFKGDPDPKWDPLIKAGENMAFWADVASALGWVYLGLAGAGFVGAIVYGAGAGSAAMAGLNLARHFAIKGLSMSDVFDGKTSVGSCSSLQQQYLRALVQRKDILHRYFNANESSVAFDAREAVAEVIEATTR